jgi:DeoR/GlpR family transcriptional regulator of sugar metabolism
LAAVIHRLSIILIGESRFLRRLAVYVFIHRSFYRYLLDEVSAIGFYAFVIFRIETYQIMSKRNTPQRRHNILALLNERGEVSVDELAKRFETSEVTIRKDLAALESNGLLLRRYGGAITLPQELVADLSQPISRYKQAIARAAVARIREHARIIIDSGSTTASMIPELGQQPGLVVMTNSLHVANALSELEHEPVLLMTGGTWDPHSESFQGQVAEQVLRSYDFDQLFIGADGIDLVRGTTTFNELLGLSRVMAEVAREVVVMVEADKIGRKIPNLELPWSSVHTLITDDRLPLEARDQIQARGITLICAAVSQEK